MAAGTSSGSTVKPHYLKLKAAAETQAGIMYSVQFYKCLTGTIAYPLLLCLFLEVQTMRKHLFALWDVSL